MGGLSRRRGIRVRGEQGYILLDVLVALIVVMIGFAALLGGLGLASSIAVRRNERVMAIIEERNAHAVERTTAFRRE